LHTGELSGDKREQKNLTLCCLTKQYPLLKPTYTLLHPNWCCTLFSTFFPSSSEPLRLDAIRMLVLILPTSEAAWPNGKASDYDSLVSSIVYQEIVGSSPIVVNQFFLLFFLLLSDARCPFFSPC
jgi:hypothetical protein